MSRSRMMKDDDPAEPNTPSPRTTIVGGRPPEEGAKLPPVPTGIQRLLRLASINEDFRQQLVEKRGEVAVAAEVGLTASEAAVLAAIPAQQLEEMAQKMPPPAAPRREFLRQTAATAVVLLGGAALGEALTGCRTKPKEPETEVDVPDRPDAREMETEGGAAPDEPPDERPDHRMQAPGGAAPDEPPERPDNREMEKTGGAAPDEPPERPIETPKPTGIRPDLPPERPKDTSPTKGIRPDLPTDKSKQ